MSLAIGTPHLEDTYAQAVPELVTPWAADRAPEPVTVVRNEALAAELGLDLDAPETAGLLVGQVPDGVRTVAQAYAGHQFGMYQPRLGDGRAVLVGELVDTDGRRRDLHLKGSGRTPFARGGDGRAALGPMLREYVMGEAMHALGIPTSRGLAVTATGDRIPRDPGLLPGAVLARVASSHLRVGTFQYASALAQSGHRDPRPLKALTGYAIARHHPRAADAEHPALALLQGVVDVQAALIAQWMGVGFVHGVMNTDNTTISGETIDYGPCAFMERYDPATVFSSIDHQGRYAYAHQPPIARWNLARLAEALLPLIAEELSGSDEAGEADTERAVEAATEVIGSFGERYEQRLQAGMAAKLGLREPDPGLVTDLLDLLGAQQVDWTTFFRAAQPRDLFVDREAYDAWATRWDALRDDTADRDAVNPLYIPRNHLVEEALTAAEHGDLAPFGELLDVVTHPYTEQPGRERHTEPGTGPYVTYCGT